MKLSYKQKYELYKIATSGIAVIGIYTSLIANYFIK